MFEASSAKQDKPVPLSSEPRENANLHQDAYAVFPVASESESKLVSNWFIMRQNQKWPLFL